MSAYLASTILLLALLLFSAGALAQEIPVDCGSLCDEQGACTLTDAGVCAAVTDADCQRSAACERRGECSAVAGTCRATSHQACARSFNCTFQQACYLDQAGGRCIPAPHLVAQSQARPSSWAETDADAPEPSGASSWYGWQNLLAYGGAAAAFAAAVAADSAEAAVAASIAYQHAGPIVHFAHGNWGRGGAAIAMNTAVPTTAMAIGAAAGGLGGFVIGGIAAGVGLGITTVIDVAALAWEPEEREPSDPELGAVRWTVVPTANGLAVTGTF